MSKEQWARLQAYGSQFKSETQHLKRSIQDISESDREFLKGMRIIW